jgi:hypothetical protein
LPIDLLDDRGMGSVAFLLSFRTGSGVAQILGHRLSRYNFKYQGPQFISPLFLKWEEESEPVPVFDSDIHGYHGEMDSSAKLRGDGPAEEFTCSACGRGAFSVSVQFDYGGGCYDLVEDEPDLDVQDYFQNIMVEGRCLGCSLASGVLDMNL